MKSYNHLREVCISETNRRNSLKLAKRSKRIKHIMKNRRLSDDAVVEQSYEWIINYENAEHVPVYIYDGITRKERIIIATRKAKKISKKEGPTIYDACQMLSYLGWIDCTDTYCLYLKRIKPYISFQRLKRKVSQYDRYDDRRVYHRLVIPYIGKGGKSNGSKLSVRRKHSKAVYA